MDNKLTIIQGEDREIKITLKDEESQKPFDLTDMTGAEANFLSADGGVLKVDFPAEISLVEAKLGELIIKLKNENTSLLKVSNAPLPFELKITRGAETRIIQFPACLSVLKRLV